MTTTIARCACCGSENLHIAMSASQRRVQCTAGYCMTSGPYRQTEDDAIAAWNALMTRAKPIPEGAVRVEIPVHYKDDTVSFVGEFCFHLGNTNTYDLCKKGPIVATIIAHIVPPVPQVVDGEVV